MSEQQLNRAVGRRKTAIARVRLQPGDGRVLINEKSPMQYLGQRRLEQVVLQPLRLTDTLRRFDVSVKVEGGGVSGQAGAIAHGISRALLESDEELRPTLKKAGLQGILHAESSAGTLFLVTREEPDESRIARALDMFHCGRASVVSPR